LDREEFASFYAASFPRLVGQLYAMTGDQAEAQDVVQEAFVRAWTRRSKIDRDRAPESWVRVTAWRIAASRWRRARNGALLTQQTARPDSIEGPDAGRIAFVEALRKLPAEQRRALVLYHLCDLTIDQIAAETDAPAGTVKARLARGRRLLRLYLWTPARLQAELTKLMVDVTSELRQMADDGARLARPLEVDDVIRHSERRHRRFARMSFGGLSAIAVVVAVIIGTIALPPASRPASHQPVHAQLTAWTVVKRADGTVFVKIRQLRDPAGLQARLRADGVPASVVFYPGHPVEQSAWSFVHFKNNPCHEFAGGESRAQYVVTGQHALQVGFTVHPSAIPRGAGVQFVANSNVGYYPQPQGPMALFEWLVQASPRCTGS
jgi:RNA polymerase sigma-70 factor (ECF subfamily)